MDEQHNIYMTPKYMITFISKSHWKYIYDWHYQLLYVKDFIHTYLTGDK